MCCLMVLQNINVELLFLMGTKNNNSAAFELLVQQKRAVFRGVWRADDELFMKLI